MSIINELNEEEREIEYKVRKHKEAFIEEQKGKDILAHMAIDMAADSLKHISKEGKEVVFNMLRESLQVEEIVLESTQKKIDKIKKILSENGTHII